MLGMAAALQYTVLMVTPSAWPDKGGVERHLRSVSQELNDLGWQVLVLVPPKQRPAGKLGLLWLWGWMLLQLPLFVVAPVIHIHDVFLWFWPVWPLVKLIWFCTGKKGKIITTFHGWEGDFPPTQWQKFNKWLAQRGSDSTIAVGAFLNQFYPITATKVTYGGVARLPESAEIPLQKTAVDPRVIFIGRLSADTGLPLFLAALKNQQVSEKNYSIEFWGDGALKAQCRELGATRGWVEDPLLWLDQQPNIAWVVASGFLSALEALAAGQRVLVIADQPLKQAYYASAPFRKHLQIAHTTEELEKILSTNPITVANAQQLAAQAKEISENYGWDKVAKLYQELYVV
jgi:glycosyltransferase involved in cell wall biosynthesis